MSKKRPRHRQEPSDSPTPPGSKAEPAYWRRRLFKSRYTYQGRSCEVRNWSVKIQHLGRRKTFALRSNRRSDAALEACQLYQALVTGGWKNTIVRGWRGRAPGSAPTSDTTQAGLEKLDVGYWARRLIHREYTMSPGPGGNEELSVRVAHGGIEHYFPLGTNRFRLAARRALRIYRTILEHGWEAGNRRFTRELTVAFHWLEVPLAWTYTTIHTLSQAAVSCADSGGHTGAPFTGAVVESIAGIRRALEWCLNQTDGLRCVAAFASADEALSGLRQQPAQLVLVNHSLADRSGAACVEEIRAAVPEVAGLLYSVYEDSEELFKRTPGGAGTYLLRRTGPTHFLEPIQSWLKEGRLRGEPMASAAWQYFKDSVASMPVGSSARHLANLTEREHEVLGLLSQGHPDKEIADQLGISIYTVHEHVRKIFDKLGTHNRTEAAVKFLQK